MLSAGLSLVSIVTLLQMPQVYNYDPLSELHTCTVACTSYKNLILTFKKFCDVF